MRKPSFVLFMRSSYHLIMLHSFCSFVFWVFTVPVTATIQRSLIPASKDKSSPVEWYTASNHGTSTFFYSQNRQETSYRELFKACVTTIVENRQDNKLLNSSLEKKQRRVRYWGEGTGSCFVTPNLSYERERKMGNERKGDGKVGQDRLMGRNKAENNIALQPSV